MMYRYLLYPLYLFYNVSNSLDKSYLKFSARIMCEKFIIDIETFFLYTTMSSRHYNFARYTHVLDRPKRVSRNWFKIATTVPNLPTCTVFGPFETTTITNHLSHERQQLQLSALTTSKPLLLAHWLYLIRIICPPMSYVLCILSYLYYLFGTNIT